jgi:hypothetical protein
LRWVFAEFHEINAFYKFQFAFVIKIHPESLVPQNEPPMLNILAGCKISSVEPQSMSTVHSFSNEVISASTPFSNYDKKKKLEMKSREWNEKI